jgi:hypothetical protein
VTIRNCILDKDNERFIVVFDDADYCPAIQAIADWRFNRELDFDLDDADAMCRSIFLFSPQTPPPRQPT